MLAAVLLLPLVAFAPADVELDDASCIASDAHVGSNSSASVLTLRETAPSVSTQSDGPSASTSWIN